MNLVAAKNKGLANGTPASSSLGFTSDGLGWNGFSLLGYFGDRGAYSERLQERYIVGLWRRNVAYGERPNGRGGYIPYVRYPERVTLIPPSIIREHSAHNPYHVLLFFLEPTFVNNLNEEMDRCVHEELPFQANVDDPPIRQLIALLASEAAHGGPLGGLYADHLAHSVGLRLLFLGTGKKRNVPTKASRLPRHLLGRVLERMDDLNSDLSLKTLAAEAGYSRSHFLRMFRAATGCTPHHYLLQRRLHRAQELIRLGTMSLIDIAALCGFSSHAHMSRMFRQFLGVSPNEYRRSA